MSEGSSRSMELEANAKLNPFLRVLGRRHDGFHDLETVVLPLSLADVVRVRAGADPSRYRTLSLTLDVVGDPALTRGVPVDETNLAMRAASALGDRTGMRGFAEMVVDKRIPHGGGLGGGSADAAAALRALNELWGTSLEGGELSEIGASVGSDVPALLAGAPVTVRGRGEMVTPVRAAAFDWLLVTFAFGVRTADAFGWWDEDEHEAATESKPEIDLGGLLGALAAGDASALGPLLFNDLEAPVFRRHPEIAAVKERLLAAGLPGAVMCGSGASVAGLLAFDLEPSRLTLLVDDLATLSGQRPQLVRSRSG